MQDFRQPLQQLLPATLQFWQQLVRDAADAISSVAQAPARGVPLCTACEHRLTPAQAYSEAITDDAALPDFLYDLPSTYSTRNAAVFPSDASPLKVISIPDAIDVGDTEYVSTGFVLSRASEQ